MQIHPYLFFNGRCDEAIEFYRSKLGAEVLMLKRFREGPPPCPPGREDKVMHARVRVGETTLLVSDGRDDDKPTFTDFGLSLTVHDESEAERLFAALTDGGQVQMPMTKAFFTPRFGMLTDPFGVMWMVYVVPPGAGA